jgi:Chemoreceptor zinc-binding domain
MRECLGTVYLNQSIKAALLPMNITEALDAALAAHAKWKYRLMEAIETGKSEWRVGDVRADNGCQFGKWLLALPLSERLSENFKNVKKLHEEFHKLAADVLELALAGRKDEATAAMAMRSRFATVSSNLTMAVIAWKEAASGE